MRKTVAFALALVGGLAHADIVPRGEPAVVPPAPGHEIVRVPSDIGLDEKENFFQDVSKDLNQALRAARLDFKHAQVTLMGRYSIERDQLMGLDRYDARSRARSNGRLVDETLLFGERDMRTHDAGDIKSKFALEVRKLGASMGRRFVAAGIGEPNPELNLGDRQRITIWYGLYTVSYPSVLVGIATRSIGGGLAGFLGPSGLFLHHVCTRGELPEVPPALVELLPAGTLEHGSARFDTVCDVHVRTGLFDRLEVKAR